ncbi:MAG: NHLP family bacteriocin export ABC transporter peptidase/permease/ATPase subunit [Clostridia bacterium]|nr:NHLP family bacteriocin export ABC transporter peptidase/permease/ATPase subunit [Clostridia bacterium]
MKNLAKTPTVFQMEFTECGAASLAMILAYYGRSVPLEQMRTETGVSRDGCNAANILKAARKFGMDCKGFRKEPEDLKKMQMPCIIHWNFNHFVVLEGFSGKKVFLNDPALGRRKITEEELDEYFTGVVLTFSPNDSFVKEKQQNTVIEFAKKKLSGQRGVIVKLVFVGLLLVFPNLLLPVLSQFFIDKVLVGGNNDWFSVVLTALIFAALLQTGLAFYRSRILIKLKKKTSLFSAREFISKMFRLPINFFDQRNAGDLCERISNNAKVSNFITGEMAENVLNIFVAVFYLIMLNIYSPKLTLIAVGTVLINIIIVKISSDTISNASIKMQQDSGKFAGALCAGISITDSLKASGAETEYVGKILGYQAKTITSEQLLNRNQQIINAIPEAINMLGDLLILLIGGLTVIKDNSHFTIGMLIAFSSLYGSFSMPVNALVGFVKNIQTSKADINRVNDIMKYDSDIKYSGDTEKESIRGKLEGYVELKDVSFGYSSLKPPIVSDFSFKIDCGTSIAFVGASGCGKSTVSKIVSGLYAPWTGQLYFDGISINEIPEEIINASVSTVSQQITLFSGTVRDNLTMWNSNIAESDMIAAAKDACIHDVISQKPGGYDFRLTEGASNFSGGQRQRLEIARALTTNPTVLIMDEATSALDPITEKKIMDNIKRRGCTCIIVAHRLSAIRDCDQILVMNRGQIVQRGSHDELSRADGIYKDFIKNI